MKRVLHISEIEGLPEVGRYYFVPCAEVSFPCSTRAIRVWMPIMGDWHADPEIGVAEKHLHYDWRFISEAAALRYWGKDQVHDAGPGYELSRVVSHISGGPKSLRRRCARQMPEFPARIAKTGATSIIARTLEPKYSNVRLKPNCRTCPHRGFPLNGLPVTDGAVVCPGHGLRWDLTTGRMVPRIGAQP